MSKGWWPTQCNPLGQRLKLNIQPNTEVSLTFSPWCWSNNPTECIAIDSVLSPRSFQGVCRATTRPSLSLIETFDRDSGVRCGLSSNACYLSLGRRMLRFWTEGTRSNCLMWRLWLSSVALNLLHDDQLTHLLLTTKLYTSNFWTFSPRCWSIRLHRSYHYWQHHQTKSFP